jgi:hypothetical protein
VSITESWRANFEVLLTNLTYRAPERRYLTSLYGTRSELITSMREIQARVPPRTPVNPLPDPVPFSDWNRLQNELNRSLAEA